MPSLVLLALGTTAAAVSVGPVQKILSLLNDLQQQLAADGEVEHEAFEAHAKWCASEEAQKQDSVDDGEAELETLAATIEQLGGDIQVASADVGKAQHSLAGVEADIGGAKQVRAHEAREFQAADVELTEVIDMLDRAQAAIARQMALVQSGAVHAGREARATSSFRDVQAAVAELIKAAALDGASRQKLVLFAGSNADDDDFLARRAPDARAYESHSKSISQVLEELKETAEREQADLRRAEVNSRHNYELLAQSLGNEQKHLNARAAVLARGQADRREALGAAKASYAATSAAVASDSKYLHELHAMCTGKARDFEARVAERVSEQKAIAEAVAVLSGESAQHAFEAHGSMLVQTSPGAADLKREIALEHAAEFLKTMGAQLHSTGLAQMAARFRYSETQMSASDPFTKVRDMIEQMITRLMTEGHQEVSHKEWCDVETSKSTATKKKHQSRVQQLSARVDKASATVSLLADAVASMQGEVADMQASQAEATRQRNAEKAEYKKVVKEFADAQAALQGAVSVLKEYYESNPQSAAAAAALLQSLAPKFEGAIFSGAYERKLDASTGVLGLLEVVQADFAKMDSEAHASENAAAREYERLMQTNRENRAALGADIRSKHSEKVRLQQLLGEMKEDRSGVQQELDAVLGYVEQLRVSCTAGAPQSFEERQKRRSDEVAALRQALEVLSQ